MARRLRNYHVRLGVMECIHKPAKESFTIFVLGCRVEIRNSTMCSNCTRDYLNTNSTICNECRRPIFPGQYVGLADNKGEFPFVHSKPECNPETKPVRYGQWWGNSPHVPWLVNFTAVLSGLS